MSRRITRFEYLKSLFPLTRLKREKKAKEKRVRVKTKKWWYQLPNGMAGVVFDFTRSQARAQIKRVCQLRGRVPVGTVIEMIK